MPAHCLQSQFATRRSNLVLLNGARMEALIRHKTRKHPIFKSLPALGLPTPKESSELRIQRKLVFRAFRLHAADATIDGLYLY